jgi:hypothetical protein
LLCSKGKPVYNLVDPDGNISAMQARSQILDDKSALESLPKLGDRLKKLPNRILEAIRKASSTL